MIRPTLRLLLLRVVAAALAVSLAVPVHAGEHPQAKAPVPLAAALTGAAKAAYESGKILYNNGDYQGALSKWRQAYELSQDPRLLFNMAACEKSLRHYRKTQTLLQRYLREGGPLLTAESRSQAESALAAIRDFVGFVVVQVNEAGATVKVDGEVEGQTPLPEAIALDLGPHLLRIEKSGFVAHEEKLDVAGGSRHTLTTTLLPQATLAHLAVVTSDQATIVLDEKTLGIGRWEGNVAAGPHTLILRAPHKQTHRTQLDLPAGSSRSVNVSLVDEKVGGPVWPWIVGGVALAGGLAVGGYFLFQTTREEPGPQTTGTIGTFSMRLR